MRAERRCSIELSPGEKKRYAKAIKYAKENGLYVPETRVSAVALYKSIMERHFKKKSK